MDEWTSSLWGRCGMHITLGIDMPAEVIRGRDLELPLAVLILRECCFQRTKLRPFGDGPVFATGEVADFSGHLETVEGEEEKLRAFLRECGDGHRPI